MQRIAGSGHNLDLDKGAALINAMAACPQVTGDKRTTRPWTTASMPVPGSLNLKLRSLDPRPRSVGVFWSEKSPIVPQLICPVSLIVKHRDSRGRRTTTSTSPQFRG